jgi:hypothetical protein
MSLVCCVGGQDESLSELSAYLKALQGAQNGEGLGPIPDRNRGLISHCQISRRPQSDWSQAGAAWPPAAWQRASGRLGGCECLGRHGGDALEGSEGSAGLLSCGRGRGREVYSTVQRVLGVARRFGWGIHESRGRR